MWGQYIQLPTFSTYRGIMWGVGALTQAMAGFNVFFRKYRWGGAELLVKWVKCGGRDARICLSSFEDSK